MFCGLNWEDIVAGGKGLFPGWFRVKMACNGATKELSGTLLRGWARNYVALVHFQTSNFKWSYLSCLNSDSHVIRLYGKIFESRI